MIGCTIGRRGASKVVQLAMRNGCELDRFASLRSPTFTRVTSCSASACSFAQSICATSSVASGAIDAAAGARAQ